MARSRYRDYWYGMVLTSVKRYNEIRQQDTIQAAILINSIESALKETETMDNGDLRVRAIDLVYFKADSDINGAAAELYVSRSTVKRWLNSFVNLVAKNAGYK